MYVQINYYLTLLEVGFSQKVISFDSYRDYQCKYLFDCLHKIKLRHAIKNKKKKSSFL